MQWTKTKNILLPLGVSSAIVPLITTSCVYPNKYQEVDVTDQNIYFSSNNWLLSQNQYGRHIMTTYPGGAYIKIAFYGNTCGINAYCTSSFPRRIFLSCYIDNNLTPIVKSLDQALGNILIFADNNLHALDENKPHTAKIYISTIRQPSNNQDRFSWPDAIVVQGILLQRGSNIVDPSTVDDPFNPAFKFKRDKNVLIYGDDNTEMPDVGTDFNPQVLLWDSQGYECTLIGFYGMYVTKSNDNYAPQFFDQDNIFSTDTLWNNFSRDNSRLNQENKFQVKPDLIVLDLGTNDALAKINPSQISSQLKKWIGTIWDMYPNVNRFPKILLQLPYLFNNANYTDYFKAYNQMYLDILQSQNYSNISLMNLSSGANTILYYESNDKIHINQAATANLFTLMQKAITPTIPNDIQCNSSGTTINVTWSNAFPDQNYDIPPIINQFQIQYKLATATEWNKTNPINYDPNKASLYTESFTVSETGAYKVRLVAINDLPAKDSIQAYSSEITVSV